LNKIILTTLFITLSTGLFAADLDEKINLNIQVGGRTAITQEEQNTVNKLREAGVLEKNRSMAELNRPAPFIDVLSADIKMQSLNNRIQWRFNEQINALTKAQSSTEGRVTVSEDDIQDLKEKDKAIDKKINENYWMNVCVSLLCLGIGLIL